MNEAREAFERHEAKVAQVPYEEFKLRFDSYEEKIGERYIDGSLRHKHWVIWLASWQEQQRRIDELQKRVDELEAAKRDYVCDCGYLDSLDYEECDCRRHSEDLANEVIAEIVKKANFAGLEELLDELKSRAIKHGVLLNKQALRGEHE